MQGVSLEEIFRHCAMALLSRKRSGAKRSHMSLSGSFLCHNVNEQTADEIGLSASSCCRPGLLRCSVLDKGHGKVIVTDSATGEILSSKYLIKYVDAELGFFVYDSGELDHEKRILKLEQNLNLQLSYVA
jgi:hypothetical protein